MSSPARILKVFFCMCVWILLILRSPWYDSEQFTPVTAPKNEDRVQDSEVMLNENKGIIVHSYMRFFGEAAERDMGKSIISNSKSVPTTRIVEPATYLYNNTPTIRVSSTNKSLIFVAENNADPQRDTIANTVNGTEGRSLQETMSLTIIKDSDGFKRAGNNSVTISKMEGNDSAVFVHFLSYQRSGSSFLGGLFYTNPDVFFIYEPMDMVYSAMYGFKPGWAVPADTFYINGQLREMPDHEIDAMVWMLEKIYHCNMSSLPPSILLHRFWHTFLDSKDMPIVGDYVRCMSRGGAPVIKGQSYQRCWEYISSICPARFRPADPNMDKCRHVLWNNGTWRSTEEEIKKHFPTPEINRKFVTYFKCMDRFKTVAGNCAKTQLDDVCAKKQFRVVKTVRSTFKVGKVILERHARSKVIHLVRDPRGAARSRSLAAWSHGLTEGREARDRAVMYCLRATDDNRHFQEYNSTNPGRTLRIIYDQVIKNVTSAAHKVHDFVGMTFSRATQVFLASHTKSAPPQVQAAGNGGIKAVVFAQKPARALYSDLAEQWKYYFNANEITSIREVCSDFYKEIPYSWA